MRIGENNIRSRLWRRGYHLVKMKDADGAPGYFVADSNRIVCFGSDSALVSLKEIANWINQL